MKVSVVMPVYNAAPYLAAAIRSCLSQSVPCELVVVDDASTDSSPELISWFSGRNPDIVTVSLKENRGPAYAMNRGIDRSSGDIVCFAAADDIQEPNKMRVIVETFLENPGISFCYTGYFHASVAGEVHSEVHPKPLTLEGLKENDAASGGALAALRQTLIETPFREDLLVNEDSAMYVDLFRKKLKYAVVDIPTFRYRLLREGMSYSRKAEVEKVTEQLRKEIDSWNP